MVYRGHVENGLIQLDGAVVLPEGAAVRIELAVEREDYDASAPPVEDELRALWADVPDAEWRRLPADLTDHLDHYVYGTPK